MAVARAWRSERERPGRRLAAAAVVVLVVVLVLGLSSVWAASTASAQGGLSSPGVVVTAVNPGTSRSGSSLRISLTAHTERSAATSPSCRPQEPTIRCWGSLVLRVPDEGGFSVTGLEVHRVAVGDISCGDDEGGGCTDAEAASPGADPDPPQQAEVNGVAFVTDPGTTGVDPGTKVQLLMTLTDFGTAQYQDQIDVVVNRFVTGSPKPLLFDTGPQTIQQVAVHTLGND